MEERRTEIEKSIVKTALLPYLALVCMTHKTKVWK